MPTLDRSLFDRQLLRRVADGDEDALGELYDRLAPTVHAVARRVLRDDAEAEDVVQEVFLHAWNRVDTYDPRRSSVATWLVLVARSRAIDRLRTRQVIERTHDGVGRQAPLDEPAQGPRRLLAGERRRRLRAELARLPAEQRQVIELAYYADLTQRQIAAERGIPLGTVKTRTLLALRKLRGALAAEPAEPAPARLTSSAAGWGAARCGWVAHGAGSRAGR